MPSARRFMQTNDVIVATANPGKLAELQASLAPLNLALISQTEMEIESCDETGISFVENALQKARHASARARLPAIADDSGLVVPALNGSPGVRSARYAGEGATDADNNAKLLAALAGIESAAGDMPDAFFFCALVFIEHPADPTPVISQCRWYGKITRSPRGDNGFGYDPLFYLPDLGRTSAELRPEEKNAISHRGQAVEQLCQQLSQHRT